MQKTSQRCRATLADISTISGQKQAETTTKSCTSGYAGSYHGIVSDEGAIVEISISRSVFDRVIRAINQCTYSCDFLITSETRLVDDLDLSRIGRMRLAISLEEIFSVELSDDVLEQAVTVADVVTYLCRHYFQDPDFTCDADEADDIGQSTGIVIRLVDWFRRKGAGGSGAVDYRA
jgi:acyl carrier protein